MATLGATAAAGRVLFAAIPGVQPVTVIAVVAGAALGARAGVAVGALAAFVSNFFLGQGAWTPWQMLAWGAAARRRARSRRCSAGGSPLARHLLRARLRVQRVHGRLGVARFYPHTWQTFAARTCARPPFDLAHAIGNVVLALAVGPELRRLLDRYGAAPEAEVVWA